MRWLATSYGVRMPAPPEFQLSNSQNVSRPLASMPAVTSITPAGRK
jgi:hypothetical protein